jgi:hypothetical protein
MSRQLCAMLACLLLISIAPEGRTSGTVMKAPDAAGPIAPDRDFMGMVIRDPWYDFDTNPQYPNGPNKDFQDLMGAELARAGVQWVRLDIHIVGNDPEAEIAKNDYFINEVAPRHNFKVLALLSFDLLQGTDAHLLNDTTPVASKYGGGVNQYMDTWLTRALMIADRYGERIAAYELLNEQNRLARYTPEGTQGDAIAPEIVGRLITKFYRFCRYIGPLPEHEPVHGCFNSPIIMGGLHPRGTSGNPDEPDEITMTDAQYLEAIYNDPGSFKGFRGDPSHPFYPVDGIGYHPYPEEIRHSPNEATEFSLNDAMVDRGLGRMREVLNRFDPDKQFWITEVGYNVDFDVDGPKGRTPQQTEAEQALFMRDVYTSLAARQLPSGQPEIANVFWFKYEDFPPGEIIYNSKGNPVAYPQRWGVVRIPFEEQPECPGGACYDVGGVPTQYRLAFLTYRELAGLPVYRTMLPDIKQ